MYDPAFLARARADGSPSCRRSCPSRAKRVDVDCRGGELDAELLRVLRSVDELGGVQQRLRRDAADVQAGAAGLGRGVDERDFMPAIGGEKGGGVPAGTAAEGRGVACQRYQAWTCFRRLTRATPSAADSRAVPPRKARCAAVCRRSRHDRSSATAATSGSCTT